MNTRSSERICALAELLKMYADGASRLLGDQWEEGDVSCSALRRIILPDAFYTTDGLIETTLTVLNNMGAYIEVINSELNRYLPFLATTEMLAIAIRYGIGREKAHNIIKKYAVNEALKMREQGNYKNQLVKLLARNPVFKKAGISEKELILIFSNRIHFLGNALKQIKAVKEKVNPFLKKYKKLRKYEPREIL
jgi:adenylosuccinate lyase